jgi:hypothetical protein
MTTLSRGRATPGICTVAVEVEAVKAAGSVEAGVEATNISLNT